MDGLIAGVQSLFGPEWRGIFDLFSLYGGPWGWFYVYLLVFYAAGSRTGMRISLVTLVAIVSNTWLKWLIAQPRPYFVDEAVQAMRATPGFGMPSGHAEGVAAQWGAVAWQSRRVWVWGVAGFVILMTGLSRVYFGVHSVPQVLIGWLLGGVCIGLVALGEAPLLGWLHRRTLVGQVLWISAATFVMLLLSLGILELKKDFSPPHRWLENFSATVERTGDEQIFSLYGSSVLMVFGLVYGVALMGLYFLRKGPVVVRGWKQRLMNLVIGSLTVAVFFWLFYLIRYDGSPRAFVLTTSLLLFQPWFTILLPLKLGKRFALPSV